MRELYQTYLNNLAEGHELTKNPLLNVPQDKDVFVEQIQRNARRTNQLQKENGAILHEILHSRSASDLTDEDIVELRQLADSLFAYNQQSDVGTAYRIHKLIYEYALLKGDRNLQIRQLCQAGTALFYMNPVMKELGVNIFGRKVTEYFTKGASYLAQYDEINDPATRGYIIRCMTNLCITDEKFTCTHQPCRPYDNISTYFEFKTFYNWTMDLYNSTYHRVLTPDFPWDAAIYNLNYHLSLYYQFVEPYHPPEIISDVLQAATYIYEHPLGGSAAQRDPRVEQIYATARWKAGQITTSELADTLYELIQRADPTDFTEGGITLNLQLPLNFEYAYRCMNRTEQQRYKEKMTQVGRNMQEYLLHAPHNEYSNLITKNVSESIRYRAQHDLPMDRFFDFLLCCHSPTYIHVRMAALLSRELFLRMVECCPETLLELYDVHDVEELKERRHEFAERIYLCALYHDVGKIMLLDYIGIYVRPLLDEEFDCIKLHTNIGAALLEKTDPKELSVVALHHHRYYNGVGGYPDSCPPCQPQYKPIVDIVSIADCIEAATDNIGRSYNEAKTLSKILGDMRPLAGIRYSPAVLALFDDADFVAHIEKLLETERVNTYHEAYLNAQNALRKTP